MNKKSIWPILLSVSIMTATGLSNRSYAAEENLPAKGQELSESNDGQKQSETHEEKNHKNPEQTTNPGQEQGGSDPNLALKNTNAEANSPKKEEKDQNPTPIDQIKTRGAGDLEANDQDDPEPTAGKKENQPEKIADAEKNSNPKTPPEEKLESQEEKEKSENLKPSDIGKMDLNTQNSMGGGRERSANQGLEISEPVVPEAQKESQPIEINSWDDLKKELDLVESGPDPNPAEETKERYNYKRLQLKNNNYVIKNDIEIDFADDYFKDKEEYISQGLLSNATADFHHNITLEKNEPLTSFTFDGGNKKITTKNSKGGNVYALFGRIRADKVTIKDINLESRGKVLGFPFADYIEASFPKTPIGTLPDCLGELSNINVKVDGDVVGIKSVVNRRQQNDNFPAQSKFYGRLATGFACQIRGINIKDVNIDITGNIEADASQDVLSQEDITYIKNNRSSYTAMAYGFAWDTDESYFIDTKHPEFGEEYRTKNNYQALKKYGYYENININVGKSIKAKAESNAYATGFSICTHDLWLNNVNIKVKEKIEAEALPQNTHNFEISGDSSLANGFARHASVIENSSLDVGEICLKAPLDRSDNAGNENRYFANVYGIASADGNGRYTSIKNNNINIGKISVESKGIINVNPVFKNEWISSKEGNKYYQEFEGNTTKVGEINILENGGNQVQYCGLTRVFRSGVGEKEKNRPAVSAKNNSLVVDKLNIKSSGNFVYTYLAFENASNAKDNKIKYGDVNIEAENSKVTYRGLGDAENDYPSDPNGIEEITEGNRLEVGDVKIKTKDLGSIGLLFGGVDSDKTAKDNRARYGKVDVSVSDASGWYYLGGLAYWNEGNLENNHIYIEDLKLNVSNASKIGYISPGIAYNKGNVKDSTVFVNKKIEASSNNWTYTGGFVGRGVNSGTKTIENCHVQVGGGFNNSQSIHGAFAAYLQNYDVKDSSALVFNGFLPFVNTQVGGGLDHIAHYIKHPVWKNSGGLIKTGGYKGKAFPYIKNSTLISDFENNDKLKDPVLYRTDIVDPSNSTNNYLVLVGEKDNSRVAYKLREVNANTDEMSSTGIKVWKKDPNALVGKLSIAKRDFQDKYWGYGASIYKTGKDEKDFAYLAENPGVLTLKYFGLGENKISKDFLTANLVDYFSRHGGIYVEGGPIYDLLGIRGYPEVKKSESKPEPKPEPNPTPDPGVDYTPNPTPPEKEIEVPEINYEPSVPEKEDGPKDKEEEEEKVEEKTKIEDAGVGKKVEKRNTRSPKTGVESSVGLINLLIGSISGLILSKKKKEK